MNSIRKAITGMAQLTTILIIELALRVAAAINANPTIFPNPNPSGDALMDAATTANESFNAAQGGSRAQRNKLKTDMETLKNLIRAMCDYVNSVANGDTDKIIASGFEISRIREPKPVPVPAKIMEAIYVDTPGVAEVKWSGAKYHTYYVLQVTTNPSDENSWKDVTSLTARQYMVTGLASGKRHYFRVIAVGTRGVSTPSDIASVMVA